jgi:hypothetical protein
MATTTQDEFTNANVLFHGEDIILIDPFHEDWDSEIFCAHHTGINGFARGYVRATWGAAAKVSQEARSNDYIVEVDGSVVATIRNVIYDLANADQAAFCGYGEYCAPRRRWHYPGLG